MMTVQVDNNDLLSSATLRSISFSNTTFGPGTQAQKDQEWQDLFLTPNPGQQPGTYQVIPVDPPDDGGGWAAVATFSGGVARFDLNITVQSGAIVTLYLFSGASLTARDGDALDLSIPSAAAVNATVPVNGSFPIAPSGDFPVDGMAASQIDLFPVSTPTLPVGSSDVLALDVRLPANGYQADVLQRLAVLNVGTARDGQEITAMNAWRDDGDDVFEASKDTRLGTLAFTGDRWQITGLLVVVPITGLHVFFTVDVAELAEAGRTVRLALPTLPDVGAGMASADDGPIDRAVANPSALTIAVVDRIALALKPINPGGVAPGQRDVPLLALVATNTYAVDKTLVALAAGDASTGSGTQADLDGELASLALRDDANGDGVLDPGDPTLATAFFVSGRASFGGFTWTIPAGKTRRLFVSGDVALLRAADGDVLAGSIASAADFEFADPTALSAVFPLGPGAAWKVNGMVAAEVQARDAPGVTLGASDGPALALDLVVRRNGYVDDVLDRLSVVNLGTAPDAELVEVHLWSDGGDGVLSGDDQDLGVMAPSGGTWVSGPLATPLGAAGARLFVTVRTAAAVSDSATARFAVPKNGIDVATSNDGPIDQAVVNPDALLLSTRELLASLDVQPNAVTIGQSVTLSMTVRNVANETINGVAPAAPTITGTAALALTSGPTPGSAGLASGGQQVFTWTFVASTAGTATFADSAAGSGASSGNSHTSLNVSSDLLHVFQQAATLPWSASTAMPLTVNRGQSNVVPMFFTFGQGSSSADVSITGLRLRVESSSGAGIVPADLLARVAVQVGSTTHVERTSLETSGSTVDLPLATPITVSGGAPVTAAIALDIAAGTVVPNFRLAIPDSTFLTAEDAATGAPVTLVLQGQSYPVLTGLARVVAPATELDVSAPSAKAHTAGQGQKDVALATLRLLNPGVTGVTSDVRVASFALLLRDTAGVAIAQPSQVIERLKVHVGPQVLADRPVTASEDSLIDVALSPLLSVPVNAPLDVSVTADLPAGARLGTFRVTLGDSLLFDARDPNSGNRVAVVYGADPVAGDSVTVQAPAESVAVVGVPRLPSAVAVGSSGVVAFHALLRHPGAPGVAAVRIDSLVVRCVDEGRNPLTPALYVKRMHVLWNGAPIATLSDPPGPGNAMALGLPGPMVAPGSRDTLTVTLDFDAAAPPGTFELVLNASGLLASDANTRATVAVAADSNFDFPVLSGLTHLAAPARTLVAGLDDRMPAAIAADGSETVAGSITLLNDATASSGAITVDHLGVRAADAGRAAVAIGAAVASVSLYRNGTAWATASLAPADTEATLAGSALALMPQTPEALELRFVARAGTPVAGLRLGFTAADVGVVQPGNPLLTVAVVAPPGHTFPLWSEYGGFVVTQLEPSYSNFPNPFAAGREATHFAYYLPAAGRVSLRIWTPRGEPVASLIDGAPRAAGLHQDDAWDGRNGRGRTVANGVYLAELVVELDGGGSHRLLRKVAVVR
jgi:hypothetical protein